MALFGRNTRHHVLTGDQTAAFTSTATAISKTAVQSLGQLDGVFQVQSSRSAGRVMR